MSCFLLPKSFLSKINSILAKFWWGSKDGRRKVHWLKWESLCLSKLDGGLGFHDFEAFNMGLLAKQWWRLIHDDDLLTYRILKARYFPSSSIHEANLGSNPSFLWRSLMAGKRVVEAGGLWRVGSGESIRIWEDCWVWQRPNTLLQPQMDDLSIGRYVSDWIDQIHRCWKEDVVKAALHPSDAAYVLKIPISRQPMQDKLIWREAKNGILTVRSAYHVALKVLGRTVPHREDRFLGWKLLWSAKVMPKVKNCCWKMIKGIVPTTQALRAKGIPIEDKCPVCGLEGEDRWHAFFNCTLSQQVWALVCPWSISIMRGDNDDASFWARWLREGRDKNELELGLLVCWLLWKNRNSSLHESKCERAESLVAKARGLLYAYNAAMDAQSCRTAQFGRDNHWIAPHPGLFKVNVDAAVRLANQEARVGVIIRDYAANVLLSANQLIPDILDVEQAELYAILFGLDIAQSYGCSRIIVESDPICSLDEIERGYGSLSCWGAVVTDILDAADAFDMCSFSYICRQANTSAHNVAKHNVVSNEATIWLGSMPPGSVL